MLPKGEREREDPEFGESSARTLRCKAQRRGAAGVVDLQWRMQEREAVMRKGAVTGMGRGDEKRRQ